MKIRRRKLRRVGPGPGAYRDLTVSAPKAPESPRTDWDSPEEFGRGVLALARRISRTVRGKFDADDVIGEVVGALVEKKIEILRAPNPDAHAYVVAWRAAVKLYRNPDGIKSFAVGRMNLGVNEDGEALETTTQKLEYLDGLRQQDEMTEEWAQQSYEAAREIPGLRLRANAKNLDWLHRVLMDGFYSLPNQPWPIQMLVCLHLGMYGRKYSFVELSRMISISHKAVTARRVGQLYEEARATLREYLVRKLEPVETTAPSLT